MNLDTESATQTGMEGHLRSSSKHLLLQVWCGLLTVAMVAMAALITSIKLKPPEDGVPTLKPDNVSPTVPSVASLKSRSSFSYIQLISLTPNSRSWIEDVKCVSCSLVLHNNTIHCRKTGLFFIYAQVTFSRSTSGEKPKEKCHSKSLLLERDAREGQSVKSLVGGTFPCTTETVSVAKIVNLNKGDGISLKINGDFSAGDTFWGAYQLNSTADLQDE